MTLGPWWMKCYPSLVGAIMAVSGLVKRSPLGTLWKYLFTCYLQRTTSKFWAMAVVMKMIMWKEWSGRADGQQDLLLVVVVTHLLLPLGSMTPESTTSDGLQWLPFWLEWRVHCQHCEVYQHNSKSCISARLAEVRTHPFMVKSNIVQLHFLRRHDLLRVTLEKALFIR